MKEQSKLQPIVNEHKPDVIKEECKDLKFTINMSDYTDCLSVLDDYTKSQQYTIDLINCSISNSLMQIKKDPLQLDYQCVFPECSKTIYGKSFLYCIDHQTPPRAEEQEKIKKEEKKEVIVHVQDSHLKTIDSLETFQQRYIYMMGLSAINHPFHKEDLPETWIEKLLIMKDASIERILIFVLRSFNIESVIPVVEMYLERVIDVHVIVNTAKLLKMLQKVKNELM